MFVSESLDVSGATVINSGDNSATSTIAHRRISRLTKELLPIDRGRRRCGLARRVTLVGRETHKFLEQDSQDWLSFTSNAQGAEHHYLLALSTCHAVGLGPQVAFPAIPKPSRQTLKVGLTMTLAPKLTQNIPNFYIYICICMYMYVYVQSVANLPNSHRSQNGFFFSVHETVAVLKVWRHTSVTGALAS